MYAIIITGGKQYRVAEGDIIDVELLDKDSGPVEFSSVLFANDGSKTQIGSPNISNFFVFGEVLGTVKGEKVKGLKYKASHNQCRTWGHRQKYTRVKITGIGSKKHNDKRGTHGS
jgi:large subunit ribosomal protein L21